MEADAKVEKTQGELLSRVSLVKLVVIALIVAMLSSVAVALILTMSSRTSIVARNDSQGSGDGMLYYPPKPYFIVYPRRENSLQKIQSQAWQDLAFDRIYLPDLANPQRLSVTSSLADLKLGFTMHDGWMLTSLSVDSQSVADKIVLTSGSLAGELPRALDQLRDLAQRIDQEHITPVQKEIFQQITAMGFALLELVRTEKGVSLRIIPVSLLDAVQDKTTKAP